jgi:hypothetical protein
MRSSLLPAVAKLIDGLPEKVYGELRARRPSVEFTLASLIGMDECSICGPSGGPYTICIGRYLCFLYMEHGGVDTVAGLLAHELGHGIAGQDCMMNPATHPDEDNLRMQKEADDLAAQWGFAEGLRGYLLDRAWDTRHNLREGQVTITMPSGKRTVHPWTEAQDADMQIALRHLNTRIRRLRPSRLAGRTRR